MAIPAEVCMCMCVCIIDTYKTYINVYYITIIEDKCPSVGSFSSNTIMWTRWNIIQPSKRTIS